MPINIIKEYIMEPSKEFIIWLAGFFDGEGSISIGKQYHKIVKPPFKQVGYVVRTSLAQNNKPVLEGVKKYFGGCLKTHRIKGNCPTYRQGYNLVICNLQANKFLTLILPYLQVKQRQAKLALEYNSLTGTGISSSERRKLGAICKEKVEAINWAA
jgi:hypothetical protein